MRIIKEVETLITVQQTKGIVCNRCGEVFQPYDDRVQSNNIDLGDYGNLNFDLCNDCILAIIKEFTIVPTNFMSNPGYTTSFDLDHDLHQQLFNEWKTSGEWNNDENPYRDAWENGGFAEIQDCKPANSKGLKIVK